MKIERRLLPALLSVLFFGAGSAVALAASKVPEDLELLRQNILDNREVGTEEKTWKEADFSLPPAPEASNLIPIDVGSPSGNRFAVDVASVSVGADEVIRYTIVITSPAGARNVAHEGMRCETAERRVYAFGRADGSWSSPRRSAWVRIVENNLNRHHAALFKDYFCTTGASVSDTATARRVLTDGNPLSVAR